MERGEHSLHLLVTEKVARHFGMRLSTLIRKAEQLQEEAIQAEVGANPLVTRD